MLIENAVVLDEVVCPDHVMKCPDRTTCCKLFDGGYGCCPYPEGVCCKDGAHCCPHATQCDIKHGRCLRSNFLPSVFMGLPEFNDIYPPMEKVFLLLKFLIYFLHQLETSCLTVVIVGVL